MKLLKRFHKQKNIFRTTEDEIIQFILNYFSEDTTQHPTFHELANKDGVFLLNAVLFDNTFNKMLTLEIIGKESPFNERYKLLRLGFDIIEAGGWKKYQKYKTYQITANKRKHILFWPAIIFSVIVSLGIPIYQQYTNKSVQSDLDSLKAHIKQEKEVHNQQLDSLYKLFQSTKSTDKKNNEKR